MTAAAPARRMTLGSVTNKRPVEPDRVFLYGVEKIGKSTFGACAPSPIFISAERGLAEVDPMPHFFPEATSFQDVLDAIVELETKDHGYRTLVIDSLDWVERLIEVAVCSRTKTKSGATWTMADYVSYGQGQKVAIEDWRKLTQALERLQIAKPVEVILIAHATTKTFDDPVGIPYTRYEPQMSGNIGPKLVKQWAKSILFARHEYTIVEGEGAYDKAKGRSTGRRVMHTQWQAAFDAGSRYDLPAVLDLDYAKYAAAREANRASSPARLLAEAKRLLAEWAPDEETRAKSAAAIDAAAGNVEKLLFMVNRLRTRGVEKEIA